ncbi:MAG: hypothetical protein LBQ34_01825 [Alphaproteobacteria bacterium]|jgi:predicted transcriptional regulator|nr:hypothetical protein [Alphaproteobacteria bacterium]
MVRISEEKRNRLAEIAKMDNINIDDIVDNALEDYISSYDNSSYTLTDWQLAEVDKGLEDIANGNFVDSELIESVFRQYRKK